MNQTIKDREPVTRALCRLLYGEALPFNLVKSPLWKEALRLVGEYGKGLKLPSYHEARVTYLKKEVDRVTMGLEKYKEEWKKTGCTIMSDGWTDGKQRSLTNFLVNNPSGTVFVRSIDTSSYAKDAKKLLDDIVQEVGEENVVQVVTDSASAYVLTGNILENKRPNLFWSPCTTHLFDLILHDIGEGKAFKDTIDKAKKSDELKSPLRELFASKDWAESNFASTLDGKLVERTILADPNFWKAIKYCLKCVAPIYKLLRLVDGDAKLAMGYIYEAIKRAKEQIKDNFDGIESRYQPIWEKIDRRWDMQIHRPLHAAGYLLNPSLHFDKNFKADVEVKKGLFDVIERMVDRPTGIKIHVQMEKFKDS